MAYRISGIDPAPFTPLFGLDDQALAERGALRRLIREGDTIPERVELRDAPVGTHVLLVNYTHQPARNPYHACHAIFIREGAVTPASIIDAIPDVLAKRLISLRAFDGNDVLVTAEVVPGQDLERLILDFLARPDIAYLHAHFAGPGCFAALIQRD